MRDTSACSGNRKSRSGDGRPHDKRAHQARHQVRDADARKGTRSSPGAAKAHEAPGRQQRRGSGHMRHVLAAACAARPGARRHPYHAHTPGRGGSRRRSETGGPWRRGSPLRAVPRLPECCGKGRAGRRRVGRQRRWRRGGNSCTSGRRSGTKQCGECWAVGCGHSRFWSRWLLRRRDHACTGKEFRAILRGGS